MWRKFLAALLGTSLFLIPARPAWAHLPRPIEKSGLILAIDEPGQTLRFEESNTKKQFRLHWDRNTEFIGNQTKKAAADLKTNQTVVIYFKAVSFRLPLLRKVVWQE